MFSLLLVLYGVIVRESMWDDADWLFRCLFIAVAADALLAILILGA